MNVSRLKGIAGFLKRTAASGRSTARQLGGMPFDQSLTPEVRAAAGATALTLTSLMGTGRICPVALADQALVELDVMRQEFEARQRQMAELLALTQPRAVEFFGALHGSFSARRFALTTDVGSTRKNNEDSVAFRRLNNGSEAFVVADGMGGHRDGDKASRIAALGFIDALEAGHTFLDAVLIANYMVIESLMEEVREKVIDEARARRIFFPDLPDTTLLNLIENNEAVARAMGVEPVELRPFVTLALEIAESHHVIGRGSPGSTLVAAVVDRENKRLYIAQVGDSRAKIVAPDGAYLLTVDHSVWVDQITAIKGPLAVPLDETVLQTLLQDPEVVSTPNKHAISSCLGAQNLSMNGGFRILRPQYVRVVEIPLIDATQESTLLLYSDGAFDSVTEPEISELTRRFPDPAAAVREILALALRRHVHDNVTLIAIPLAFFLDFSAMIEATQLEISERQEAVREMFMSRLGAVLPPEPIAIPDPDPTPPPGPAPTPEPTDQPPAAPNPLLKRGFWSWRRGKK